MAIEVELGEVGTVELVIVSIPISPSGSCRLCPMSDPTPSPCIPLTPELVSALPIPPVPAITAPNDSILAFPLECPLAGRVGARGPPGSRPIDARLDAEVRLALRS